MRQLSAPALLALLAALALLAGESAAVMSARSSSSLILWYQFSEGAGTSVGDTGPLGWTTTIQSARASWLATAPSSPERRGIALASLPACPPSPPCPASVFSTSTTPTQAVAGAVANVIGDDQFGYDLWLRVTDVSQTQSLVFDINLIPVQYTCETSGVQVLSLRQETTSLVAMIQLASSGSKICSLCTMSGLSAGSLVHVAFAYSAGLATMFVNGSSYSCSAAGNGPISQAWATVQGASVVAFGARRSGEFPWNGRLYQFAMYNNSLSAGQIAANLAAGPYNTIPLAAAMVISATEDVLETITLSATDQYDTAFNFTIATLPAAGTLYQVTAGGAQGAAIAAPGTTVTNPGGRVLYLSALNGNGAGHGSFTYTAFDGEDTSPAAAVTVNVAAVNDQSTASAASGSASGAYGTPLSITGLSVADADAGDVVTVTVQTVNGLLTLGSTAGLSLVVGDGTDDSAMRFRGSVAAANAALGSLSYETLLETGGADSLALTVFDDASGAVGPSGSASVSLTFTSTCS
eukprot:c53032_g1_i1.p1 GENE.c53032_g1_i1~~c53032_g1_i1.p1  ORF type:complete len:522 (-),score=69.63 c53032_g1_i1:25-1590(-)